MAPPEREAGQMTGTEPESTVDGEPKRDLVLVTIDCWRHDALAQMPSLRERIATHGYDRAEAVCAAPATRGAFGALFGGRHYPAVYAGFDDIRDDSVSLPAALAAAGYATGGFVGSNPFLSAWAPDFDTFWNDDLDMAQGVGGQSLGRFASTARRLRNYLRFEGRTPADTVAERASEWYESTAGPRFCWLHMMDAHAPYLPGMRRAIGTGPLSIYRAHWHLNRHPDSLTASDRATLRASYEQSLRALDDKLDRVLEFVDDDARVVFVGDHGEEFDHGVVGHARLYEETVRVPLLARGVPGISDGDVVRQLDLPPTLLSALGRPSPDAWWGRPHESGVRDALLLNHSPRRGRVYAGVRTPQRKLIRTIDPETDRVIETEAYDLDADPTEQRDVSDECDGGALSDRLDEFLARAKIRSNILETDQRSVAPVVEDRLQALGYQ